MEVNITENHPDDARNLVTRLESVLNAIATNSAKMRSTYDLVDDLADRLESVKRRQDAVLAALDSLDREYVAHVKAAARHAVFMRKLNAVIALVRGSDSPDGEGSSLAAAIASIEKARTAVKSSALMSRGKDFVYPVSRDLEALRPLYRTLQAVLVAPLPDAARPAASGTLADDACWTDLVVAIHGAREDHKLRLIADAIRKAADDMARVRRQAEKMKVRLASSGSTPSEEEVARRKSYAARRSIEVIRKRMVALSSSFYRRRAAAMEGILSATRDVASAMRAEDVTHETIMDVKAFRNRHPVGRTAEDIVGLDVSMDAGKGRNPTLGELMRTFHDNAQRRIASGTHG